MAIFEPKSARRDQAAERLGADSHQRPVNAGSAMSEPTRRDIFKIAAVMGLSHLLKGFTMAANNQVSTLSSALVIPDSLLAKDATHILREYSTDLLFNHSMRVYLFAVEQGRQQKLRFDPELLYIAAAFHDLGLTKKFSSQNERFEVDGANAARQFLNAHQVPEDQVQTVWETIALHTTPGVTQYMRPEVALLYSGVALDVLGRGFDQFPSDLRDEIVAKYPRKNFKEDFLKAYFGGFAHKPGSTYGTVNAGVVECFMPGYKSPNACDLMAGSPFPDSPSAERKSQ
jgi:HD domain-containing protein